jgi:hypothetical protein
MRTATYDRGKAFYFVDEVRTGMVREDGSEIHAELKGQFLIFGYLPYTEVYIGFGPVEAILPSSIPLSPHLISLISSLHTPQSS